MRHIIFRGKKVNTGEWVFGSLIRKDSVDLIGGYEITPPTNQDPGGDTIWTQDLVIRNTVGEYTGLRDLKGNTIYEGDLVWIRATALDPVGEEAAHKIVFGDYVIGTDDYGLEHKTPCFCIEFCDGSGYCRIEADTVVVVGNIFDTPEKLICTK